MESYISNVQDCDLTSPCTEEEDQSPSVEEFARHMNPATEETQSEPGKFHGISLCNTLFS